MADFEIRNEDEPRLAALVWGWCCTRLGELPTGTALRFAPASGLFWAHPPSGADPFILGRCRAPLEWLQ